MRTNMYVITYAPWCVRDAQIWQEDPADIDPMSSDWVDLTGSDAEIYVGICSADSEKEAIRMAAEIEQCQPDCLKARFIDSDKSPDKGLWCR